MQQLNGTSFVSSRGFQQHAWFYRILPSVAHRPLERIYSGNYFETNFAPSNPKVQFAPKELAWDPFDLPDENESVDFVQGIRTIGGHGDPTTKEGLAVHIYTANTSMEKRAFCSTDGDMLLLPQHGRLDIQTEMGKMMVRPGELAVIQAGLRFKVSLPDGPSRGYIQEIFGAHYELPELGVVGSNGCALPRDFEYPLAHFDIDQSPWTIVYKLCGELFACQQDHTPFDVVAWHGNYAPYKYQLERFINVAHVDRDQSDPTCYCVLTAKSKIPGVALTEFLIFTPKWIATQNTFRPPYYHRNVASEVMGMMYGEWKGTGHVLAPGGLSYEPSFLPHGESQERFLEAASWELKPERIMQNTMAFMMHINSHLSMTNFALKDSGKLHLSPADMWDNVRGGFLNHLETINKELSASGRDPLNIRELASKVPLANGVKCAGVPNGINGHVK
ncbi:putative homogentisate [Phaeomoniella chlamydospora]|uniref:homogentisate 1,2-dioxygenase n=1 Tax=Phaeomoniella chlamydospora TaxID=158046 RepID=A0A0G2GK47_PHACM|nr:putative homogentisate [Phaeomoniella chlamydospora]